MDFVNQPSFAAGEVAPELYGRVDQDLYYIGLRTCKNFMIFKFGGAANRMGTEFVAEIKDSGSAARLVPFQFNEEQTYALVFGDNTMRVIKDGGEVLEANQPISTTAQTNPVTVTVAAHGWSTNDSVFISSVNGMTELNGRVFRITNVTANTFDLLDYQGNPINGTQYGAYVSSGFAARIYTLATPYPDTELFNLNYAQSNDVMTVCHNDYFPRDITRTGHAAWTIDEFDNVNGPFVDANINQGVTCTWTNGPSTNITITSAGLGIFTPDMVGDLFYIQQGPNDAVARWEAGVAVGANAIVRAGSSYYQNASGAGTTGTYRPDHLEGNASDGQLIWQYQHSGFGVARIISYTSPTVVVATQIIPYPSVISSVPSYIWAKQAWSVAEGYPAACVYHKQRFLFGGTKNQPSQIWFSGVGARTNFGHGIPVLDDEEVEIKLSTNTVNAIRHLLNFSELIALTSSSEHLINGTSDAILATEPPIAKVQSYSGSAKVPPIIVDNTGIFVQDYGGIVRSLQYNNDQQSFGGIDLTARSPHLFQGKKIVDWAYQKHPLSVVWVVMSDGTLNGFTFMDEQKVYAWHRHETDGFFESVCTIREGDNTAVYFIVRRTINGVTKRYVERFRERYFDTIRDAYFVDCGLSYDGRNYTEDKKGIKTPISNDTITISGGTTWENPEVLTLTSSASIFKSSDVGDQIVFWSGSIAYRFKISAFTDANHVSAVPTKTVPAEYRNAARTDWEFARDSFLNLNHIEGKQVSVLADGNVVSGLTVTNGRVTLPQPAAVVHIGLPYTSDLETLDMAQPGGQTKGKTMSIPRVKITYQESRGALVSTNGFENMVESAERLPDMGYDQATTPQTGVMEVTGNGAWDDKGRIAIRQALPLPVIVNGITPEIILGNS